MSTSSQLIENRKSEDAQMSGETSFAHTPEAAQQHGLVIINADDWGNDPATTDRALDCYKAGAVSSVSAMVFMADSVRAADTALLYGIDAGLHLNFTTPYTAAHCPPHLKEHQQEIARSLAAHRFAGALFHPRLTASFEYVVKTQLDEYERLYGARPTRLDGHHHMHLCSNVLCQGLLPQGSVVRRNLTFERGEKFYLNRLYRRIQDRRLARRHRIVNYFFNLHPVMPRVRLRQIFELGAYFDVELETHPIRDEEYRFLMDGEIQNCMGDIRIANGYVLRSHRSIRIKERSA